MVRKLVMDNLLHELQRRDWKIVAYANDLLVMIEAVRCGWIVGMGSECMAYDECMGLKCSS